MNYDVTRYLDEMRETNPELYALLLEAVRAQRGREDGGGGAA